MQCISCRHDNPDGARFCNGCGQPLAGCCGTCGAKNPPGARFCNQCGTPLKKVESPRLKVEGLRGDPSDASTLRRFDSSTAPASYTPKHLAEKILQSKSALEGERKQVTVLFADVKGSMELAEQLDPEEWHKILDRFFQILTDGVHRFDGTVNQYTGDGIMALFGAPIAHEDHAQRACWAALSLRDEVRRYADELRRMHGLSFSVRMGLNSGEVVGGKIGDDLRMDYTAQGHVVGLAQRMEQLAEPGTACLTEHTQRLVEGYFQLRGLGALRLKGVSTPVEVSVLEGAGPLRTRLDAARARGFSRFVGRAREMEALQSALSSALEGKGQIVGVVGEAGVGKSRLCLEFVEGCGARGIPVWQAHCPVHGRAIPMLPVLELTRHYFGVNDHDVPADARRKVAGTLALLDEGFHADLSLIFDFLQIPDPERPLPPLEPEERQRRLPRLHPSPLRSAQRAAGRCAVHGRPALDRRRKRRLPGTNRRGGGYDADDAAGELSARVSGSVDESLGLPAHPGAAAGCRGN
jgi:class 3 adenylate cyclase